MRLDNIWIPVEKKLPPECELVSINVKGRREMIGWYSNKHWYGIKLKPNDVVVSWKKKRKSEK